MGLFNFFSKEKKETLDQGLSKTKESVFSKLSPSKARVTLRSADYKLAGRVNEELGFTGEELGGENFFDDVPNKKGFDLGMRHVGGVLRGDNDVDDLGGYAIHIANGNLRLRVRTEPFHFAALADARDRSEVALLDLELGH